MGNGKYVICFPKFLDRGGVRKVDEEAVEIVQVQALDQKGEKG